MNIAEILRDRASTRPESVAIVDAAGRHARRLTFAELDRAATSAAGVMHDSGLRPGDHVLVLQPMSAELYIALAAVFRLGLVAMFPDPSGGIRLIDRCCALAAPRAMIAGTKAHLLRLVSPGIRRIPVKCSIGLPVPGAIPLNRRISRAQEVPIQTCSPEAPALLTFTSGGTGAPKAAMRSHGFLLAQHHAIEQVLELTPGEVDLSTLPIFVLANLASGVTSVVGGVDLRRPDAIDAERLIAQTESYHATRAGASPAVFQRIVEHCEAQGRTLPHLKRVFTGGGPVTPDLLDRLARVAPHACVTAVYGSTEAEPIARISRDEISSDDSAAMLCGRGLLAGRPVPSVALRVTPDRWGTAIGPFTQSAFNASCLPADVAGEIVVSGEHVLSGYVNGHGDSETKFDVGAVRWHRTGDAGYLDDRGRLWLLGRCAARIEDARGTLYPFSVDHIAARHPGIRRAAVVAHRGKRVLAVEMAGRSKPPAPLDALLASLAFANVDELRVLKRLPVDKRHNAKVDYPSLCALLERTA
jgi:acyl-CoA synthetase (AMP-forming)/AMP-acid ligase II